MTLTVLEFARAEGLDDPEAASRCSSKVESMRLALRFARPYRVWHARLRARLEAEGHHVALEPMAARPDRMLALALWIERFAYASRSALFAVAAEPIQAPETSIDLNLSLDGGPVRGASLTLLFDAKAGEAALPRALLTRRAPVVTIIDGAGRPRASGRPATERPDLLSLSIDHVLAATIDLVVTAVRGGQTSDPYKAEPDAPRLDHRTSAKADVALRDSGEPSGPLGFVVRRLLERGARLARRRRKRAIRWRVATRLLEPSDAGVARLRAWPLAPYAAIADDGTAYHADPFPFEHQGRRLVFVERYLHASRRGVIAVIEIDPHGVASEPRIVLDGPGHLSYPFVFEAEGGLYMLPETSDARRLQLFRSEPFPDRWVPYEVLVDDIVAADATPIFHEGLHWIFASLAGDGGSSWDRLGLFHAPSMLGPWMAHKANPVLVDAGAARPAGAMWHEDGVLMRVAQDCRTGYGAGLRICRVDRLDEDGYAQTVIATLAPPDGASAAHTLNRSKTMEVIDLGRVR